MFKKRRQEEEGGWMLDAGMQGGRGVGGGARGRRAAAMLPNLYCEMHEICSFYINEIVLKRSARSCHVTVLSSPSGARNTCGTGV